MKRHAPERRDARASDGVGESEGRRPSENIVIRPPARFALRWTTFAWPANRSSRSVGTRERRLVRKKGLEPSRPCGHKLLRLARLPIPPLPHEEGTTTSWNLQLYTKAAVNEGRG